ncbi:methionyl-tRNA formyltransferase [Candidatus Daviesbacteria bacterium]|nr:methionyl-tRNA formyltransferase [Candidatus Daviesbacteria bacterium]
MKTLQHPQIIPTSAPIFPITEENIKKYLYKMPRHNIEIVFFGSDPWSIHVLTALEDHFDVKAVVAAPEGAVANYFKGLVLTLDELDENFTCDLMVVASYGKIIPKSILDIPRKGALNVHPSLLPKYRGASPVPATILNGEKETGVTIIKMDRQMDHGPIVATRKISLTGKENMQELINKLFQLGAELLVKIIPDFVTGKITLRPQNPKQATYCPLLTRKSGFFNIDKPPKQLDRMIRAYYPWPGVWTRWNGKIVKIYPDNMIQMEGKKILSWKDFLNGYPDFPLKI